MKIKYLPFLLLLVSIGIFAEDCSYLKDPTQSFVERDYEGSFNYEFPYQLCELNSPIHEEATEYIQGIRDIKDKTVVEIVRDVGNKFCRGYFWDCDEKSFYGRFLASCDTARAKTAEILKNKNKAEPVSSQFISYSYIGCPNLAEEYITSYKEVAMEEVARYHGKAIEESNAKYLNESHEKMGTLGGVWDTFLKIFGNIARSFQWFTKEVYNA